MKIAYFVPYITASGPVSVVKYICEELKKSSDIEVFYFKDINNSQFPVETRRISFFDKINFDKYDILHSHGVLPDAYMWWHRRDIKRAKSVTTLHNYVKEDFKYGYNPLKAFILQKAWSIATSRHDRVVTLSKDAIEYYSSFWKNKKISYIYNGIPTSIDKQIDVTPIEDGYIKIGAIGSSNISKIKGFDQIVRALAYLPNHSLYIAGGGREVGLLRELALEVGVDERVNFVGYQKNIIPFINSMDIFVVSSRSEGFSLALQEIVRAKKPVVCSNIAIFRELFDGSEVGFFDLDGIDTLASEIESIWINRDLFVERAYVKFVNNYSAYIMAKNYLNLYQDIITQEDLYIA